MLVALPYRGTIRRAPLPLWRSTLWSSRYFAEPCKPNCAIDPSLVIDCSRHLDQLLEVDVTGKRCAVEPGIVLDELNRKLKAHGLWFPVDISTASRATIGGMVDNNSCGARSLRYGNTREKRASRLPRTATRKDRRIPEEVHPTALT